QAERVDRPERRDRDEDVEQQPEPEPGHPGLPLDRPTARTVATEDAFVKFRKRSMRFEQAAVIGALPERVWSVVSDWERQASWMPDVSRIEVRGPERELGASMTVRTKVFGIPAATDLVRVIVWEPPRRLVVDHVGVVTGTGQWRLDPVDERSTRFTGIEEIRMMP